MMQNNEQLHVVLGGAGAIGQAVITELQHKNLPVKAVERTTKVAGVETSIADLLESTQTKDVIAGATHVYVCVGLPYVTKIWEEDWPTLMKNVIDACADTKAKLIFFDNIYLYGPAPLSTPFTEEESQKPQSKKGVVRKIVADMVLDAHASGKIEAVIGRSSDFYGPHAKNSSLYVGFLERMLGGKNPQWLGTPNQQHTYAFTLDNGRALIALALNESTYGEAWHLPAGEKITETELVDIINKELNSTYKISYMPRFLLAPLSLFIPILKEVKEMLYQFDNTYEMSWDKFQKKFPNVTATSYEVGIKEMIASFKKM